jgi:hypothetical protein
LAGYSPGRKAIILRELEGLTPLKNNLPPLQTNLSPRAAIYRRLERGIKGVRLKKNSKRQML